MPDAAARAHRAARAAGNVTAALAILVYLIGYWVSEYLYKLYVNGNPVVVFAYSVATHLVPQVADLIVGLGVLVGTMTVLVLFELGFYLPPLDREGIEVLRRSLGNILLVHTLPFNGGPERSKLRDLVGGYWSERPRDRKPRTAATGGRERGRIRWRSSDEPIRALQFALKIVIQAPYGVFFHVLRYAFLAWLVGAGIIPLESVPRAWIHPPAIRANAPKSYPNSRDAHGRFPPDFDVLSVPRIFEAIIQALPDRKDRSSLILVSKDMRRLHDLVFPRPIILASDTDNMLICQRNYVNKIFIEAPWKLVLEEESGFDIFRRNLSQARILDIQGTLTNQLKEKEVCLRDDCVVRYVLDNFSLSDNYVFQASRKEVFFFHLIEPLDVKPTWFSIGQVISAPDVVINVVFSPGIEPALPPQEDDVGAEEDDAGPEDIAAHVNVNGNQLVNGFLVSMLAPSVKNVTIFVRELGFKPHRQAPNGGYPCFNAIFSFVALNRAPGRTFTFVNYQTEKNWDWFCAAQPCSDAELQQILKDAVKDIATDLTECDRHAMSPEEIETLGHHGLHFITKDEWKAELGEYDFRIAAVL
ncbi:hypothetical protein Q8F55_007421 [Vanrija albida]|uniref:F-box domain-containing protein n=1 Tax=Vanrija albida TaxID=181172 RepID=A0ABR3PTH7_9TREE